MRLSLIQDLTSDGSLGRTYGYDRYDRPVTLNNSQTITWDALGRLKTMTGTLGADYLYDADGQLAGTTLNGSTVQNRLVPGPWPDEIALAWQGPDLTYPLWSAQDRMGSVVSITDGSGAMIALNTYDEYGRPGYGNGGRLMYTGQMWLPDWGMYHYKGRQYRPDLGRFLQTDPIGYAGGMNLYGYVAGDPVNLVDPMGLDGRHLSGGEMQCYLMGGYIAFTANEANGIDHNECRGTDRPIFGFNNGNRGDGGGGGTQSNSCPPPGLAGTYTNLVGISFAAAAYISGKIQGTSPRVYISGNVVRVTNSPINVDNRAVSIGNFQIYSTTTSPDDTITGYNGIAMNVGRHETGHSYQAAFLGDFYVPMIAALALTYGNQSPLELQADEYAQSRECTS